MRWLFLVLVPAAVFFLATGCGRNENAELERREQKLRKPDDQGIYSHALRLEESRKREQEWWELVGWVGFSVLGVMLVVGAALRALRATRPRS
jgi:hypothetical protein